MRKILYILIGPKGSGKTYIGSRINKNTDIKFLRVEPIWLKLAPGENGWETVEKEIDHEFQQHSRVMIESLGAGEGFNQMYSSLKNKYEIKLVKIYTDLEECLRRVRNRDNSEHIPVSDDKVEEYNKIAASINHKWDAIIDNNSLATDEHILRVINSI
ncbi:shikimate kinase [Allocoleopsis franciscana]|uniref:Shikimate kinase n=1 Tax=Allocoleopsis franciscana PCC 7113 TaxID=1173027 RepID=K9W8V8_9CYAN|nr:shikimate kinase [Allocoleopsis franciscana]AFZ16241.1 shikimate kinase [Allocoleopsis franciscana PCC 7113]